MTVLPRLLAEYKRRSPWAGEITSRSLPDVVAQYDADPNVFGISVVADPDWGGSIQDIERARELTNKPILAKFRFRDEPAPGREALAAGADWYLTYDWVQAADDPAHAWLELHEAAGVPPELPLVVVCNNRDVGTGEVMPDRALEVFNVLPRRPGTMVCAASGYKGIHQVPHVFDFGLIGTHFLDRDAA